MGYSAYPSTPKPEIIPTSRPLIHLLRLSFYSLNKLGVVVGGGGPGGDF